MQSQNRTTLWIVLITAVLVILIGAVLVLSQNNGSQDNSGTMTTTSSFQSSPTTSVTTTTTSDLVAAEMQFDLAAQNNSGQDGTVTLEEVGDQVRVTISVSNPVSNEQPAHIHNGSCPTPGAVVFPLQNVVNGSSVTMIDTTLAELATMGELAVNVHKSSTESSVYFACGDLDFLL